MTATLAPVHPTPPQAQPARTLELCALPSLKHAARILAQLRTAGHDATRKPHEDLGAGKNEQADFWGLLAELTLYLASERHGLHVTDYCLVAEHAPIGPDFHLNGRTFNVKAVPPGKQYISVNERQRTDPRHYADFVLPVVFTDADTLAVYAPVPAANVATWELRQAHSAYRGCHISKLRPLFGLRELLQW